MPQYLQTLPHRDRTDGFFIAKLVRAMSDVDLGAICPSCHEPWLRPTNLPGRYRCVNCLHRFELRSVCPNCGEHSTIVRMSNTALYICGHCQVSMLAPI